MIFNDYEAAQFLINERVICVDVETNTTPPKGLDINKYGLTYLTDMTHVSFYAPNNEPVVFTLPRLDGDLTVQQMELIAFLCAVLTAEDKVFIAHNAVFDFRHLLGHLDIQLHWTSRVWDTQVHALRFQMADYEKRGRGVIRSSLDALRKVYLDDAPVFHPDFDNAFYTLMKERYRMDFDLVSQDLQTILRDLSNPVTVTEASCEERIQNDWYTWATNPEDGFVFRVDVVRSDNQSKVPVQSVISKTYLDDPVILESFTLDEPIWAWLLDVVPLNKLMDFFAFYLGSQTWSLLWSDPESVLNRSADQMVAHYVAMDTVYTYRLYEVQNRWIQEVSQGDVEWIKGRKVARWQEALDLADWETRISRSVCNQAGRGVVIDFDMVDHLREEWAKDYQDALDTLREIDDSASDWLTERFIERSGMLLWFSEILRCVRVGKAAKGWSVPCHVKGEEDRTTFDLQFKDEVYLQAEDGWRFNWNGFVYSYRTDPFEDIERYMDFPPTLSDALSEDELRAMKQEWVDFVRSLRPYMTPSEFVNRPDMPQTLCPTFRWDDWVADQMVSQFDGLNFPLVRSYILSEWVRDFITSPDAISIEKRINKTTWQRFYLFNICGVTIPDNPQIKYTPGLAEGVLEEKRVPKFLGFLKRLAKEGVLSEKAQDYLDDPYYVFGDEEGYTLRMFLNLVQGGYRNLLSDITYGKADVDRRMLLFFETGYSFSASKDALKFYMGQDSSENSCLEPLYTAADTQWKLAELDNIVLHAQRDGRIHSLISRQTRTGRYSSALPNMQNKNMYDYAGVFVGEDGHVLCELDYSNAENVSAAMTSGDNAFAMATENPKRKGGFHTEMALVYRGDDALNLYASDYRAFKKTYRDPDKGITFGNAYGAGMTKLAVMTNLEVETVRSILDRLTKAFPVLALAKKRTTEVIDKRLEAGYVPYVRLWDGSRVPVPMYASSTTAGKVEAASYKGWNYINQGAVGAMVSRAMAEIDEFLKQGGYKSYLVINVHDSLIVSVAVDEADVVLPKICEIMGEQVPMKLRKRTLPRTHFVSEIGPENATKWGKRLDGTYPIDPDFEHFWNRWGKHRLPDDVLKDEWFKREAPTWRGPVHEGWTIEAEMEEDRLQASSDSKDRSVRDFWERFLTIGNAALGLSIDPNMDVQLDDGRSVSLIDALVYARQQMHNGSLEDYEALKEMLAPVFELYYRYRKVKLNLDELYEDYGDMVDSL